MKMKRFFANKQKKKKTHGSSEGILDTKSLDISDNNCEISDNTRSAGKKKQRHHKKKLKKQKSNEGVISAADAPGRTYLAPNGTSVVLRKSDRIITNGSALISHAPSDIEITNKRIPGSESSSRTASSASASSSSSSRRWSVRRPWSLVESFRGQSLDELSQSRNSDPHEEFSDITGDPHPVPPGCTLPRGAYLDDSSELEQSKHKSMMLDFSFFRRFKRSSVLSSPMDQHKNTEPAASVTLVSAEGRGSFRLKGLAKNKKKKKRRSWNESNLSSSVHSGSHSRTTNPQPDVDFTSKRLMSATESLNFDPTEASIPEERGSNADTLSSSRSHSNGSSAGTYVVTSGSETSSRTPSEFSSKRSSASHELSVYNSAEDLLRCERCQCTRQGSRRSHCRCSRTSRCTQVSVTDTDPGFYVATKTRALTSKSSGATPCSVPYSLDPRTSASLGDIYDSGTITNSSSTTVQASFSGSLKALPQTRAQSQENVIATTLPRRRCIADDEKFKLQSPKNNAIYASSPQLSLSSRRSFTDVQTRLQERPKSTLLQLSGEKPHTFTVRLRSGSSSSTKFDNVVVDSPIKRAIGYPGVVLRRHQNRQSKKSNDPNLNKSASSDFLSGERRAKQVMSLNMEDLPTYEKMLDDSRWRASTLSSGGLSKVSSRMSEETGRARLRAAVLYHRYAGHCTSSDNVSAVEFFLGKNQSIEDLENMDDDEFLNLYLSGTPVNSSHHESNRSSQSQEPSSKRVKTLRKSVASFANLISPGKPSRSKLQRSSSFKESSGPPTFKPYRPPGSHSNGSSNGVSGSSGSANTPGRRGNGSATKSRGSKLWCETFDHSGLDQAELKRQEAIFELYQGERVMVQDLKMAKQTYRDSMMTLKMLTAEEVTRIFGKLDCLLPLHEDLLARLEKARAPDGRINMAGHVFIDWFPTLSPYNEYCANQADAKETLDAVVNREERVRDFLQRCLESPFSRKLNLWSYLDLPRSRLVKYPLLLKAILKVTPPDHEDATRLEEALKIIDGIITRVDYLTGERQSRFVQSKLEYLDDKQKCKEVDNSRKILCSGQLKSNRGTKLHVFLFDLALVLTRSATRGDKLYQVYRQPLPLKSLVVETEEGGKLMGSFKGGLLSGDKAKHSFRVKSEDLNVTYTLIAADEHDKKQWVNSLQEAINEVRPSVELAGNQSPISRRGGSEKSVLDKAAANPTVTVKRSSSVKSESGTSSPWSRNRSMTVNGNPVRRNSKEKKDSSDVKKKSKLSPLTIRRNSKSETLSVLKTPDLVEIPPDDNFGVNETNACRRSRSLTSSPITFLSNLPKRTPRRGSTLARSESCSTKPPSGRVHPLTHHHNVRFATGPHTPPLFPRLPVARSIPDLSKTQNDNELSLEDVKKQLSPKTIETKTQKSITADLVEKPLDSSLIHKPPNFPSVAHLMIPSPDHPAASNTSQNFPTVEEDVLSPLYKSLVTTSSSLSFVTSLPTTSDVIALPLSPPSLVTIKPKFSSVEDSDSNSSSSESLDDVNPLIDDVEMILDEAGEEQSDDDCLCGDDVTYASESTACTSDVSNDVLATLNDVIDNVCEQHRIVPCSDQVEVCCRNDYITITADDGSPWQGNDVEVTV